LIRVNLLTDEADMLHRAFYRWWTVKAWREEYGCGVKLGPVTIVSHRWFDDRIRVSVTTAMSRREHIIFGGPLA